MSNFFFYLPERLLIRVTGSDCLRYLNGQVTNDLKKLLPGEAMQACLLTPKGKLSAVVWATLQEEAIILEAPCDLAEELPARLDRYLVADDVMLEVIPSEPTVHIFGELLHDPAVQNSSGTFISRLGLSGKDVKVTELPADFLKQHHPLSEEAVEILRIEQGIPQWGKELTVDRLPPEARLERQAIDYNKGCYVGQEVVSRLRSVGHVNRLLVSLVANKEGKVLEPGMKLFSFENREKPMGFITSAIQGSNPQTSIALGYVLRDYALAGKQLLAGEEGHRSEVMVKEV